MSTAKGENARERCYAVEKRKPGGPWSVYSVCVKRYEAKRVEKHYRQTDRHALKTGMGTIGETGKLPEYRVRKYRPAADA